MGFEMLLCLPMPTAFSSTVPIVHLEITNHCLVTSWPVRSLLLAAYSFVAFVAFLHAGIPARQ